MKCFCGLTFLILFLEDVHGFDYCSKSNYHLFCGVDCLRSPSLCNDKHRHSQLSITKSDITAITDSLNNLRNQAVIGKMDFITYYWDDWHKRLNKHKPFKFNLKTRPYKMNLIVSFIKVHYSRVGCYSQERSCSLTK